MPALGQLFALGADNLRADVDGFTGSRPSDAPKHGLHEAPRTLEDGLDCVVVRIAPNGANRSGGEG